MTNFEEDQYPWAALGIAKTTDLRVIKSAYAKLLRTSKPDDDPAGYQQLRSAYEFAQFLARNPDARFVAEDDAVFSTSANEHPRDNSDLFAPPMQLAQPVIESTPTEPPASDAEPVGDGFGRSVPFAAEALEALRRNVQQSPTLAKDELARALAELPIDERQLASQIFAEWILEDGLPDTSIAALLTNHFLWRKDYQIERVLGFDRANSLRRKLDWLFDDNTQAETAEEYKEVRTFSSLIAKGERELAVVYSLFASATMFRVLGDAEKSGVEYLGVPREILTRASRVSGYVYVGRIAFFFLAVVVGSSLFSESNFVAKFVVGVGAIACYMLAHSFFGGLVAFNEKYVMPTLASWANAQTPEQYEFSKPIVYGVFAGFASLALGAAYMNAYHTTAWPLEHVALATGAGVLVSLFLGLLVCSRLCTPQVWLPMFSLFAMTLSASTGDRLNLLTSLAASGVIMAGLRIELVSTAQRGERTKMGFLIRIAVGVIFILAVGGTSTLSLTMWILAYVGAHFAVAYLANISTTYGLAILWIPYSALLFHSVEVKFVLIVAFVATLGAWLAEELKGKVKRGFVPKKRANA